MNPHRNLNYKNVPHAIVRNESMTDNADLPDPVYFQKLLQARMPFGKYKNYLLIDIREKLLVSGPEEHVGVAGCY